MAEVKSKQLSVGYKYHFNIIYNHARSRDASTYDTKLSLDFAMAIVVRLSQMGYNKSYYYDRDSIAGSDSFGELLRVIKGSECTIVILTNNFMKDSWSGYSRKAALKTFLDKSSSHKFIPLALDLHNDVQPPEELTAHDILYFPKNWQYNCENEWNRLFKVFEINVAEDVVNQDQDTEVKTPVHTDTQGILSDKQLKSIAAQLGAEWTTVALHLDLSQQEIQRIQLDNPNQSLEQIYKSLLMWRNKQRDVAEQDKIRKLLEAISVVRKDLAEDLKKEFNLKTGGDIPATGQVSTATPTSASPAPDGRSQRSTVGPTPANLSAPDGPTNLSAPNLLSDEVANVEAPRNERLADEQMPSVSAGLLMEEYGSTTDGSEAMVDVKQAKTQSCDTNNSNSSNGVQLGVDTVDTAEEVIVPSKQNDSFAAAAATSQSLSKDNDLVIDRIPSCRFKDDKMVTRRPETLTTASATGVSTNSTITQAVQQSTGPNTGSRNISPAPELGHNDLVEDVPTLNPEFLMITPSDLDLSIKSEHPPSFSSLVQGPQEGSSVMEDTIQPDTSFAKILPTPDLNLSAERDPERPMTIGAEGGDLQSNEPSSTADGVKGGTTPVTAGGGSNNDTARQTSVRPETSPDESSLKGSSSALSGKPQKSLFANVCLSVGYQFFNPFSSSSCPRY